MYQQPVKLKPPKLLTPKKAIRFFILLVLLLAILLIGVYNESVFAAFDRLFYSLFAEGSLLHVVKSSQAQVDQSITKRSWLTVLSFGLLYTGLSMLFLHVYFNNRQKTKIVLGLYGLIFVFCAMLVVIGKLGNIIQANQLSRHLIDLVVSPFPIVLLIPALSYLTFPKQAS